MSLRLQKGALLHGMGCLAVLVHEEFQVFSAVIIKIIVFWRCIAVVDRYRLSEESDACIFYPQDGGS
jgi:hypothetical protein